MSLPALSTATFMPWATPAAAARSSAMCEVNDISPPLFFLVGQEAKGNYCWHERGRRRQSALAAPLFLPGETFFFFVGELIVVDMVDTN